MKISEGKLVTIEYDLFVEGFDGELVESVKIEEPAEFVVGDGEMLETFEEKLLGMQAGDTFKFVLKKEEAYGEEDDEAVAEFPKSVFTEDGGELPNIGDYVPMEDDEGLVFDGVAVDITDDFVIIDFNHPLVGEDLYFSGKVIEVKEIAE